MKRVVLAGYYGFNNAGDEAILYSVLRSLRQKDRDLRLTVLSANPEKTRRLHGVDSVNRWKMPGVIRAIATHDVLVFGGGSLLQDVTSRRSLQYYLGLARLALFFRKKVYFMAQGIGPLRAEGSRSAVASVLDRVDTVTLRDLESKQLLLDLGVHRPRMELTADAVLGLYRREIEGRIGEKILGRYGIGPPEQEKLVGLAVRDWQNLSQYKKVLARVADGLADRGYQILLVPFHFPGDVGCARELARHMEHSPRILREECGTVALLGILGRMQLVFGMRMHSIIMAAVMGTPAIGLSYDPKIDAALDATGQLAGGRVENLDADRLLALAGTVLEDPEGYRQRVLTANETLRARARRNTEILREILAEDPHE